MGFYLIEVKDRLETNGTVAWKGRADSPEEAILKVGMKAQEDSEVEVCSMKALAGLAHFSLVEMYDADRLIIHPILPDDEGNGKFYTFDQLDYENYVEKELGDAYVETGDMREEARQEME